VSRQHGKALVEPSKAWQAIRKAAGLPHLRLHDLRRSFGSWLGDAGFTSKQIGTALGHKSDITSRVYMALGDDSKRAAVDAVERLMAGKSAKVTKLPSARKRRA
jgi:integrase